MINNENLINEQFINKITPIKCKSNGDIPLPLIGHSLVLISSNQFLIFGGMVFDNKFTNDTFLYNLTSRLGLKLSLKKLLFYLKKEQHTLLVLIIKIKC